MSGQAADWREFERLAAQIYENLVPQGAVVTHDDRIQGRSSSVQRQIDVSIRFNVAGHEFLTIVQARDRAEPADVNSVGEFASVVEDVGASKGVLISRSGFTGAAQNLARTKGIDLCNVHDASTEKWALDIRVPILWIDLSPNVRFAAQVHLDGGDSVPTNFDDWVISPDGGITRVRVLQTFERLWNDREIPTEPESVHHLADPRSFSILGRTSDGSDAWRPLGFDLVYTVQRRAWIGTFSPEECTGILHYKDGLFIGRFPVGAIPRQRGDDWVEVDDPDELALDAHGMIVTTEQWQVEVGTARTESLEIRHAETGEVIEFPTEEASDSLLPDR